MLDKRYLLTAVLVMGVASAPVTFAGRSSIEARVDQLERTIEGQASVDLLNKLNAMQDEIAKLRGVIDEQEHEMQLINRRQESIYNDLDQRLDKISTSGGTTSAIEKKKSANLQELGASAESEAAAYNAAYAFVEKKMFAEAEVALQEFLWKYPNGKHAPNAHYWLGELHLQRWRANKSDTLSLNKAKDAFAHVQSRYKEHHKAADSMIKLGMVAKESGDLSKAKDIYNSIIKSGISDSSSNIAKLQLEKIDK